MYKLMFWRGNEAMILDEPYVSMLFFDTFMDAYIKAEELLPAMYAKKANLMTIYTPSGGIESFEILND